MVKLPKIPETSEDFNDVVSYLESGTFPTKYNTSTKRTNFQRRCKNFAYDRQKGYLFFIQQPKDENSRPVIKRVVPVYDTVLRAVLFERFHVGAAHFDYHKTYTMIYEQHIGITQGEVKKYVSNCPTCIRNTSIKEKADLTPVIANGPLERIQVDLVDFLSFAEHNDGYSYVLTMIDVFSRYVWAIPLPNKEGTTIHDEMVKVFMVFGPPSILQADNGSEFITSILKRTCEVFNTKLVHGRARHPQSQGKIERFNQTLGRHLTKMLWNEISQVQGYRWIDILPSFVLAYNKAPHETHKKSPYEAFFGFKMRGAYDTPDETIQVSTMPEEDNETTGTDVYVLIEGEEEEEDTPHEMDIPAETITNETVTEAGEDQNTPTPGETITNETVTEAGGDQNTPTTEATQENNGQVAAYEAHVMQVEKVRREIAKNDELYRNKLVVRGSVHQRKLAFEPGDVVVIAPDHDTNQKTRKRKLEQVCSNTGKVVGMCSNNRTVRVEVNGEIKTLAAKNLRKLRRATDSGGNSEGQIEEVDSESR